MIGWVLKKSQNIPYRSVCSCLSKCVVNNDQGRYCKLYCNNGTKSKEMGIKKKSRVGEHARVKKKINIIYIWYITLVQQFVHHRRLRHHHRHHLHHHHQGSMQHVVLGKVCIDYDEGYNH